MEPTQFTGLTTEVTRWIRGENKPRVIVDVDYMTILTIMVGVIVVSVVSQLIVNAITK